MSVEVSVQTLVYVVVQDDELRVTPEACPLPSTSARGMFPN